MRLLIGWPKRTALTFLALACVNACGSPDRAESANSFCAAADALFNHSSFASDGGGVVEALRSLDLSDLGDADQNAMTVAIGKVETTITEFHNGRAPDGWTTEPAATEAARICGHEMQRFFVMP